MQDTDMTGTTGEDTGDMTVGDTDAVTVTTAEAAVMAGVSARTVRRWITQGYLPAEESADGYRVFPADLPGAKMSASGAPSGHSRTSPADTHIGHGRDHRGHGDTTTSPGIYLKQIENEIEARYLDTITSLRGGFEIQVGQQAETFQGWLAEKDAVIAAKEEVISAKDETIAALKNESVISQQRAEQAEQERDALRSRLSEIERQQAASSGSVPVERPEQPKKPRQRRWWLRLFGIDE